MRMIGLDIIGAASSTNVDMLVKSVNTTAYAANLMARDGGIATAGDDDPTFMLQPGAKVTAAGPPVKNNKGVTYISVTVPGKDGLFWIRQSSLSEVVEGSVTPPIASTKPSWFTLPAWANGPSRWQVGLGGLGVLGALGLMIWGLSGKRSHGWKYGKSAA